MMLFIMWSAEFPFPASQQRETGQSASAASTKELNPIHIRRIFMPKEFCFLILQKILTNFANDMGNIQSIKYLISTPKDEEWGIVVNTVGTQTVEKGYTSYPPAEKHPEGFYFDVKKGRVLDSWQLLYIHSGRGVLYNAEGEEIHINCGEMILLRPGVWHSYFPDRETGWEEYWIGFKGPVIEERREKGFLENTIYSVGVKEDIVNLYNRAIQVAQQEKTSYQQFLAGVVNMLFGLAVYYDTNRTVAEDFATAKIDAAKAIMKEKFCDDLRAEDIAKELGMSYSWFRKKFREYTSISPARYILSLRIQEACRLLTESSLSIKEIAYSVNFDDNAYFSAMFLREVGMTPKEYQRKFRVNFLQK